MAHTPIAVLVAAWALTPWPTFVFYRTVMDAWGVVDNVTAAKHVPGDIDEQRDLAYLPAGGSDTRLDIFRPLVEGQTGGLLMLGWSKPWLARFRQGPLEWLWRSLTERRALPFIRRAC